MTVGMSNKGVRALLFLFIFTVICSVQMAQKAYSWGSLESKLIYEPMNRKIADIWIDVEGKIENTFFYSLDGTRLNAWYIEAKDGMPTVIYCHGQGENISLWQSVADFLENNGYGVFMVDYRGHGRSAGKPFESGLYLDLESSIKYLADYKGIQKDNIILWGRSLGGAVVADVASRDQFKGVILESTFTNIRKAAMHITKTGILESGCGFWRRMSYKFVKCFPLTQTYETDKKVHKITSPLLIAASKHDETIPCSMSYELAQKHRKAELFISNRGSHHSSEWVKPRVLKFLKNLGNS